MSLLEDIRAAVKRREGVAIAGPGVDEIALGLEALVLLEHSMSFDDRSVDRRGRSEFMGIRYRRSDFLEPNKYALFWRGEVVGAGEIK